MIKRWLGNFLAEKIESKVKILLKNLMKKCLINSEKLYEVCRLLKEDTLFDFDLLNSLTSVDYIDHFEVVYRLPLSHIVHLVSSNVR